MAHNIDKADIDRFWSKVDVRSSGECWAWVAGKRVGQYGVFAVKRKSWLSHRLSYLIEHGELPENLDVCHACDNPSCVNPSHLWLGTHHENMADKVHKGRCNARKGSAHPAARIDEALVRTARALWAEGNITQREIARRLSVSASLINRAVRGVTWSHVL